MPVVGVKPFASVDSKFFGGVVYFSIPMQPENIARWDALLDMPAARISWLEALNMPRPLGPVTARTILRKYPIFLKLHSDCWWNAWCYYSQGFGLFVDLSSSLRKRLKVRLGDRECSTQERDVATVRCLLEDDVSTAARSKQTGRAVPFIYVAQLIEELYTDDDLWQMMNNEVPEAIFDAAQTFRENNKHERRARAAARLEGAPM